MKGREGKGGKVEREREGAKRKGKGREGKVESEEEREGQGWSRQRKQGTGGSKRSGKEREGRRINVEPSICFFFCISDTKLGTGGGTKSKLPGMHTPYQGTPNWSEGDDTSHCTASYV